MRRHGIGRARKAHSDHHRRSFHVRRRCMKFGDLGACEKRRKKAKQTQPPEPPPPVRGEKVSSVSEVEISCTSVQR